MNEQLHIHDLNHEGEGVAKKEGYTLFVDGALPGEEVEASLFLRKKHFGRSKLEKVITSSPDRVSPPCPYFGTCGGCQLMHLNYHKQLEFKTKRVAESFKRIGKIEIEVLPCIPSPSPLEYRNKIQLPVRKEGIGLYQKNSNSLVAIEACKIHCPLGEQAFHTVKEVIKQHAITPYNPITGTGELRHILIKSAIRTGQVLVILVSNGGVSEKLKSIARTIMEKDSAIKGVMHNKQTEQNNVILGKVTTLLHGKETIQEELMDLKFNVSPASFFQVNPPQAEQLYAKCLELASLDGSEVVLDAYCGVGTLTLLFAKHAREAIGVECVPQAIEDAKENARLNGITNTRFHTALAEKFIGTVKQVDIVLLNPPRKGCDPALLHALKPLNPKKILYISCDPATLARDVKVLQEFGYHVDTVQPFDMFPQTAHVETLVLLTQIGVN